MNRRETVALVSMTLLFLAVALPRSGALAQQKQLVSYKTPAEDIKITQQQNIDVGDVPNHIVRVYENKQTFPTNGPVINGLRLVETWQRGITDLTGGKVAARSTWCSLWRTATSSLFGARLLYRRAQPVSSPELAWFT